jgi:uncharacterized protein (DUF1778 family)
MANRTDRIEACIEPDRADRIRLASELLHTSVSSFMVEAAAEKAEVVIADHAYSLVPDDYFNQLLAALDEPPAVIPKLAEAAAKVGAAPAFKRH